MGPLRYNHPFPTANGGSPEHFVNSTPVINISAFTLQAIKVDGKKQQYVQDKLISSLLCLQVNTEKVTASDKGKGRPLKFSQSNKLHLMHSWRAVWAPTKGEKCLSCHQGQDNGPSRKLLNFQNFFLYHLFQLY